MKIDDPYRFDPAWERSLVFLACSRPRFWGRVAHAVDPDALGAPEAQLAFNIAGQVFREMGKGPEKPIVVIQRGRRWVEDGKLTQEQVFALSAYFDAAEDAGLLSEDSITTELLPVLKQRIRQQAAYVAADDLKGGNDFARTQQLINRANRLGAVDEGLGMSLDPEPMCEEIERLKRLEVLSTGVTELDIKLDGGMRKGCLGVLLGGTGSGKSMGLVHIAAEALRQGFFVLYATLELMPSDVTARLVANLTGIPIKTLVRDPSLIAPKLREALDPTRYGRWRAHEFAPLVTVFDDIIAWVKQCEDVLGRGVDLLITDYGDKLGVPKSAGKERDSSYGSGRAVYEPMRHYAAKDHEGGPIWHWTASAATRQKDSKKKLGLNDASDSMHKVRIPDLIVTLDYDQEEHQISFGVPKNRHGDAGMRVGPLPTDFETGRIAPIPEGCIGPDRAFGNASAGMLKKAGPI